MICRFMETEDIVLRKGVFDDWRDLFKNVLSRDESAKYMLWKPIHDEEHAKENARKMIDFQRDHDAWEMYTLEYYELERGTYNE